MTNMIDLAASFDEQMDGVDPKHVDDEVALFVGELRPDEVSTWLAFFLADLVRRRHRQTTRTEEKRARRQSELHTKMLNQGRKINAIIEDVAREMIVEWTQELLDSSVKVDGEFVRWGDMTIHQHRTRASEIGDLVSATISPAAMHIRAVIELEESGQTTLRAMMNSRIGSAHV